MTTQEKLIRRKLILIEAPGIGNELFAYAGYIPRIFNI